VNLYWVQIGFRLDIIHAFILYHFIMRTTENKTPRWSSKELSLESLFSSIDKRRLWAFFGFTLVELIIVITILAILATIAFMSFQNYVTQSRDSNRLSTVTNIQSGLEIFFTKSGTRPTPDEPKLLTWGSITLRQGKVDQSVIRAINMNTIPLDPKDNSKYVYSTLGTFNQYYQIGITSENVSQAFFGSQVYADGASSIVKGNYSLDPSLPSLIVTESSVTASWIFAPSVCFVLNGGQNTPSACIETKEKMSLKQFDTGLVGYWDMESYSGNILKDLSWNANNGTFSGWVATLTGWKTWNATFFTTWGIIVPYTPKFNGTDFTIQVVYNAYYNSGETIQQAGVTYQSIVNRWDCSSGTCTSTWSYWFGLNNSPSHWDWLFFVGFDSSLQYINISPQLRTLYPLWTKQWYALTFVKRWKTIDWYLNGTKVYSHITSDEIDGSTLPLYIGTWGHTNWTVNSVWIIDDVKYYGRALSPEEIKQQAVVAGLVQ